MSLKDKIRKRAAKKYVERAKKLGIMSSDFLEPPLNSAPAVPNKTEEVNSMIASLRSDYSAAAQEHGGDLPTELTPRQVRKYQKGRGVLHRHLNPKAHIKTPTVVKEGDKLHTSRLNSEGKRVGKQVLHVERITPSGIVRTQEGAPDLSGKTSGDGVTLDSLQYYSKDDKDNYSLKVHLPR